MRFLRFLKRHSFLVFFLTVQVLFVVWLVSGMTTVESCSDTDTECQAGQVGSAIGIGLILGLWCVVDFIIGIIYGVYKLATRKK